MTIRIAQLVQRAHPAAHPLGARSHRNGQATQVFTKSQIELCAKIKLPEFRFILVFPHQASSLFAITLDVCRFLHSHFQMHLARLDFILATDAYYADYFAARS